MLLIPSVVSDTISCFAFLLSYYTCSSAAVYCPVGYLYSKTVSVMFYFIYLKLVRYRKDQRNGKLFPTQRNPSETFSYMKKSFLGVKTPPEAPEYKFYVRSHSLLTKAIERA